MSLSLKLLTKRFFISFILSSSILLSQASNILPETINSISGSIIKANTGEPVSSALVTLFDANTGLQIGSTYSNYNGNFFLHPPQDNGNFYILAEKGSFHYKQSFKYDSALALSLKMIFIIPKQEDINNFPAAIIDFLKQLISPVFLGAIIGWGLKVLDDWRKERSELTKDIIGKNAVIQLCRNSIFSKYAQLEHSIQEKKVEVIKSDLESIKDCIERLGKELESYFTSLCKLEIACQSGKRPSAFDTLVEKYHDLGKIIQEIEVSLNCVNTDDLLFDKQGVRKNIKDKFEELKKHPLIQPYNKQLLQKHEEEKKSSSI